MKKLALLLTLLGLCYGCQAMIEWALIGHSMVSTDEIYRNTPSSMNIWGPVQPEEKEDAR